MCASLALADAGIPLFDLVTACGVSRAAGGSLVIDPDTEDVGREDGGVVVACMPQHNLITQLDARGAWSPARMKEATGLGLEGCLAFLPPMRAALLRRADQAA